MHPRFSVRPFLVGLTLSIASIPAQVVWTKLAPATSPVPRLHAGIAYDPLRQRVVLFGGDGFLPKAGRLTSPIGDTWEWDGTDWSLRATSGPSARAFQVMTYDLGRLRTVLYGGLFRDDTWEWGGTTWQQRAMTGPGFRTHQGFAYDLARGESVLFGGRNNGVVLGDTWTWDGIRWTKKSPPPSRTLVAPTIADASADEGAPSTNMGAAPLAFGTARTTPMTFVNGYVRFDLTSLLGQGVPARARFRWYQTSYSGVSRDISVHRVTGPWSEGGITWNNRPAHDPTVADVASVGSQRGWNEFDVTFILRDWLQGTHPNYGIVLRDASQATRGVRAMGVGHSRESAVPFRPHLEVEFAAAWPSPRYGQSMTYDFARQRVVMFGGYGNSLAETWEWDGSNWEFRAKGGPPQREDAAMAYDQHRQRAVLFGGSDLSGRAFGDTWEWDGSTWTERPLPSPTPRLGHGMVYDVAGRSVFLFGGMTAYPRTPARLADTWTYRGTVRGTATIVGRGCSGTNGVPAIRNTVPPLLGSPRFAIQIASARPSAPALLGLSLTPATVPLSGCTIYLGGTPLFVATQTNAQGLASRALPIPLDPVLRGLSMETQGFVLDPQGAYFGLMALTAGLRLRFGD